MDGMLPIDAWPLSTWICLAVGIAALVVGLFRMDDRRESRRREASRAAAESRAIGDDLLASILEAYAVGDYSGVASEVRTVVSKLIGPDSEGSVAIRAKMVRKILPALLEHPTHALEIRAILDRSSDTETKPTGTTLI